jgi:NDP-sugar pyrophosphorylase family protein
MREGVTFVDPASCSLSDGTRFGRDVIVEPQSHFRGSNQIGDGCRIGPGSLLEDAQLGQEVTVLFSVVNGAEVGDRCAIGPYSQLRPGTRLAADCRVGNFVEIKNSHLDHGCKANHLSYIGDADLGQGVNVGAGTITANYDGLRKHRTLIGQPARLRIRKARTKGGLLFGGEGRGRQSILINQGRHHSALVDLHVSRQRLKALGMGFIKLQGHRGGQDHTLPFTERT